MVLIVNGEHKKFEELSLTILDILNLCKVEMPDMVSVQVNTTFVDRKEYGSFKLNDGDSVDFLYFMGGGNA